MLIGCAEISLVQALALSGVADRERSSGDVVCECIF